MRKNPHCRILIGELKKQHLGTVLKSYSFIGLYVKIKIGMWGELQNGLIK